jgi:glycosyltransferase involved in cell wall biosynthesis
MNDSPARRIDLSIIVPTLNEEENIEPLVSRIAACGVPFREVVFVDDHSTDNTREKIRLLEETHPVRLIEQDDADVGLAGAIMRGARAAQGDVLVVMDADLRHGGGQPICERRLDARLANLAANRVPNRCCPGLSIDRSARFDVRLFRNRSLTTTGAGTAHEWFQNRVRDDGARRRRVASS